MTAVQEQFDYKKSNSWQMFDTIALKYDLLNRLLSFGLDIHWRNQLAKYVNSEEGIDVLDLATGTADVLLTFSQKCTNIKSAVGLDLSEKMMEIGRKKIMARGLQEKIQIKKGDATQIPYESDSFNNVSIAFGIRNVEDPSVALRQMHRILRANGTGLVLEFSLPQNPIVRTVHLFYLRIIVPFIGWIVSGHFKAYRYLNQTIEGFPYGRAFCSLMKEAGFENVEAHPLMFGAATIYRGIKRS